MEPSSGVEAASDDEGLLLAKTTDLAWDEEDPQAAVQFFDQVEASMTSARGRRAYLLSRAAFERWSGSQGVELELLHQGLDLCPVESCEALERAWFLANIGRSLLRLPKPVEAEIWLWRALAIQRENAPTSIAISETLADLGQAAAMRGELPFAQHLFEQSVKVLENLEAPGRALLGTRMNLGVVYKQQGDLDQAVLLYHAALRELEATQPDSYTVAIVLNNLGTVAMDQQSFERAEPLIRRALLITRRTVPHSMNRAKNEENLGIALAELGDLEGAESLIRKALEIKLRLSPNSMEVARSQMHLGWLAHERGKLNEADRQLQAAWKMIQDSGMENSITAQLLLRLGANYRALDRPTKALEAFREATRIEEGIAPNSPLSIKARHGIARVHESLGHPKEAIAVLESAVQALDEHLPRIAGTSTSRADYRSEFDAVYRDLVRLRIDQGQLVEAFETMELARARSLLEILGRRTSSFQGQPALAAQREELTRRYDRLQGDLLAIDPDGQPQRFAELQEQRRSLHQEREALEEVAQIRAAELLARDVPQPLRFEEAVQGLDPGTLLIAYSVNENSTDLLLTSQGARPRALRIEIEGEELAERVHQIRGLIRESSAPETPLGARRSESFRAASRELYRLLLGPIRKEIAASERLLILPDGPLHRLPFAALVEPDEGASSGRYLIETKALHFALSTTAYVALRQRATKAPPRAEGVPLAGFGAPKLSTAQIQKAQAQTVLSQRTLEEIAARGPELAALPWSAQELLAVGQANPGSQIFLGARATEEAVKAIAPRARILHFATHGLLDESFPLDSALVLTTPEKGSGQAENGLLQAWEILEGEPLQAELVVLSACESALGKSVRGEGLMGLSRAFQGAGARSVLASLWRVPDEATYRLMVELYGALGEGKPLDQALRHAQLQMIRRQGPASTPYSWAAFHLSGDWRALEQREDPPQSTHQDPADPGGP